MSGEPVGWICPGCQRPTTLVLFNQAFCGNDACRVFAWNPQETLDELLDGATFINLGQEGKT